MPLVRRYIAAQRRVIHDRVSIRRAVDFAWAAFITHFGLFVAILLTFIGAWVVLEVVVVAGQRFGILLWALAHVAFLIVFAGLQLGFLRVCLALRDGAEPVFADSVRQIAGGPKFLLGEVAFLLSVAAGLVVLVIPGLYVVARYGLFGFCLASGETGLQRSFRQSSALSAGAGIRLTAIWLVLVVFNALGACLLGVGLFVTIPLSALTMTSIYRQLETPSRAVHSVVGIRLDT